MVWTPAHFWHCPLLREDYRAVGIPCCLSQRAGCDGTCHPSLWLGDHGSQQRRALVPDRRYFLRPDAAALQRRLLQMVRRLAQDPDSFTGAKGLFRWSILYLFGICLLLVLSRTDLASGFDHQVRALLLQVQAI